MKQFLVSPADLYSYGGDGSRRYIEGSNVADAGHIMYCGITKIARTRIDLMLLCLQNSDLDGIPHEINVTISIVDKKKCIQCKCSCVAGLSGTCKHSIAALIYLIR